MTEALEVRTAHSDVSEVVKELAPRVDDMSIRLPADRKIADGEWVRFTVLLRDGTAVFEGVGRSQGTRADKSGMIVELSLLQFDERNEVMYERMLLARDASEEESQPTGQLDITEIDERAFRRGPPPIKPSSLPPPPPRKGSMSSIPPAKTMIAQPPSRPPSMSPRMPSAPPPMKPRRPETARPAPPIARAKPTLAKEPPKKSAPERVPPKGRDPAPARPAAERVQPTPERVTRPAPEPARPVTSSDVIEPDRSVKKKKKPMRVPVEDPADFATFDTVVSRPEDLGVPGREQALRLEIPPRLVARARALAPNLPADVLDSRRGTIVSEEAVLRAALRLGMAALAALADVDDDA